MSDLIISNAIGFVLGAIASFVAWLVLFHGIVPRIEFSRFIAKLPDGNNNSFKYRIRFKNTGRRSIIDIECIARLVIDWEGTNKNWTIAYIPLDSSGERKTHLPKIGKGGARILDFYLNDITTFATSMKYPEQFRKKASENLITLEDVLNLGSEAEIKIYVAGYDSFSGARKMFESKYYVLTDIKEGHFSKMEVVRDVVEGKGETST